MLRIGFGTADLSRLRVAGGSDFMWEVVLSLHLLQNRHAALVFDPWRRRVREDLARAGLTRTTRALIEVNPCASYFPDSLTPGVGDPDPDTGLDAVLSTPRRRLRYELARLYRDRPVPSGVRRLAEGGSEALHRLGRAVRAYHAVAVAPYRTVIDPALPSPTVPETAATRSASTAVGTTSSPSVAAARNGATARSRTCSAVATSGTTPCPYGSHDATSSERSAGRLAEPGGGARPPSTSP